MNDIRDDLRDECAKFGEVKKIVIYDVCTTEVFPAHAPPPPPKKICDPQSVEYKQH